MSISSTLLLLSLSSWSVRPLYTSVQTSSVIKLPPCLVTHISDFCLQLAFGSTLSVVPCSLELARCSKDYASTSINYNFHSGASSIIQLGSMLLSFSFLNEKLHLKKSVPVSCVAIPRLLLLYTTQYYLSDFRSLTQKLSCSARSWVRLLSF